MVLVAISSGYQTFQSKIPNGDKIPHPCQPGKTWIGVGHQNDQGSGIRNPFGVAFKAAGEVSKPSNTSTPLLLGATIVKVMWSILSLYS